MVGKAIKEVGIDFCINFYNARDVEGIGNILQTYRIPYFGLTTTNTVM